ncbi:MAG: hypothetical protein ACKPKC_05165 [Dolichospermum sp.]
MIITLLPAIALPHPKKRSPFTSQKRSHFPHPKTAIALPHPHKRSPIYIPKKRSPSHIPKKAIAPSHPQTAIAPHIPKKRSHFKSLHEIQDYLL